ncbi:MAG: endopeptidase La [Paludibacteraceae bacterium]|nr:endopeptidase La [Paludibacteraceae bacterium]MBR6104662.1 endopeptidase La [Paludibacteraceae bacterium]
MMHEETTGIISISGDADESYKFEEGDGENMPILPLRNMVLFPGVIMPVALGRKKSLNAVRYCHKKNAPIGVFAQKDAKVEDPSINDLNTNGTMAVVLKILEMPDGTSSAIMQGKARIGLLSLDNSEPFVRGNVELREEEKASNTDPEFKALQNSIKENAIKLVKSGGNVPPEASFAISNIEGTRQLINFISANLNFSLKDKQMLLDEDNMKARAFKLLGLLNEELKMLELKMEIQSKTQNGIEKQQREYFLHQQIKTIQDELGDSDDVSQDFENFKQRASEKKWSEAVADVFDKELKKLKRLSPHSPEYGVQANYLDTLVNLPWGEYSKDSINLKKAQKILNRDHYGMDQVKDRILEHLAVLKLKNDMKSPIICLYGPPGVGKTSLGKSIAEALNRKYVRISLGGLHDESEIRGHRRTYIGAMPGRIVQSLQKAGTSNPVFILDEIDKVAKDFKGDPEAALLEVLDPEQNNTFHDNFLDVDYDLSKVMFIATANDVGAISKPLLDRMELIEISGYIQEEKVEIAQQHLVPKEMKEVGLNPEQVKIGKDTINYIIEHYTRESGVRELDKQITKVLRKTAKKVVLKEEFDPEIGVSDLKELLGNERFTREIYEGNEYAGVVTGLAWTSVGGEILFIETSLSKSKQGKLTMTGNLGNVMKESAMIAMEYLKAHADQYGLDSEVFETTDVHMHVPEGATPKDGPSAGITILTSLTSAFTHRKVRKNLAMTGEITLRGKVLPVGGIKEKILAAKRAGIKEIVMCKVNQKDVEEIKPVYLKGLSFHYVEDASEVLDYALLSEKSTK